LNQCGIEFETQKSFLWLKNRSYDFYIPSLNMIIETHGGQHYITQNFWSFGGRTLEEEQRNDTIKENTAKINGVKNYVVIDCRRSESKFIKKSIENSPLKDFFELKNINWSLATKNASKSILP